MHNILVLRYNTSSNNTPFRIPKMPHKHSIGFLDLSAETRNVIYELSLISSRPHFVAHLTLQTGEITGFDRAKEHQMVPNLLATCKQINLEATPVLYGCKMLQHLDVALLP